MNWWPKIRFSLLALFAVHFLIAGALVWWRTPFTITRHHADGGFRETVVRRRWDGVLYFHGQTTEYYGNGRKRFEYLHYNDRYKSHCVNNLPMPGLRNWDAEGNEVSVKDEFERRGLRGYLPLRDEYESLYAQPTS
jgi:hypothetical protein